MDKDNGSRKHRVFISHPREDTLRAAFERNAMRLFSMSAADYAAFLDEGSAMAALHGQAALRDAVASEASDAAFADDDNGLGSVLRRSAASALNSTRFIEVLSGTHNTMSLAVSSSISQPANPCAAYGKCCRERSEAAKPPSCAISLSARDRTASWQSGLSISTTQGRLWRPSSVPFKMLPAPTSCFSTMHT